MNDFSDGFSQLQHKVFNYYDSISVVSESKYKFRTYQVVLADERIFQLKSSEISLYTYLMQGESSLKILKDGSLIGAPLRPRDTALLRRFEIFKSILKSDSDLKALCLKYDLNTKTALRAIKSKFEQFKKSFILAVPEYNDTFSFIDVNVKRNFRVDTSCEISKTSILSKPKDFFSLANYLRKAIPTIRDYYYKKSDKNYILSKLRIKNKIAWRKKRMISPRKNWRYKDEKKEKERLTPSTWRIKKKRSKKFIEISEEISKDRKSIISKTDQLDNLVIEKIKECISNWTHNKKTSVQKILKEVDR